MLHLSVKNIVNLWFGADTPIRQFKLNVNPKLGLACQKVSRQFKPPSGAILTDQYRKKDKVAFAEAVLYEFNQDQILIELNANRLV